MRFFDGDGEKEFKSRSCKDADPLPIVSEAQENLPTAFEGDTRSMDGLEHLWSRTVLTEVSEGVVVVLEGLGLFLIR